MEYRKIFKNRSIDSRILLWTLWSDRS